MLWGKKVLRVSAVAIVALAAGHAVETLKARQVAGAVKVAPPRHDLALLPSSVDDTGAVPKSASLTATPKPGLDDVTGITAIAASIPETRTDPCRPLLGVAAAPRGMISFTLSAPCNANERVVIRHSGLSFTALTDPAGVVAQTLPALRQDALVAVYLSDSRFVMGRATIPDAAGYTRVALIWEDPAELEMRVSDGDKILVGGNGMTSGGAGRVITLGTTDVASPILSSVYSVSGADLGEARITADLRITPASCGRTLRLETLVSNRGVVSEEERLVPVPLCGTSGDILVLKNLAPALKLATPK